MANSFGAERLAFGDDDVLIWAHQFVYQWPLFDSGVAWLSEASIFKFGPMMLAICWLWFRPGASASRDRGKLLDAVIAGFAALIFGRMLALTLPFELRPFSRTDLGLNYPMDGEISTWSSMPSDHAVMTFALAASLFRVSSMAGLLATLHGVLFVCLPRLYLGLHHPSDLIVGAIVGVLVAHVVGWLDRRYALTEPLLGLEQRYPSWFYCAGFFVLFEIAEMFQSFRQLGKPLTRELGKLFT